MIQRFKSAGSAQKFLSIPADVSNTFNIQRHLTSAQTPRTLRAEATARVATRSQQLETFGSAGLSQT
jgi:hypothetical protein